MSSLWDVSVVLRGDNMKWYVERLDFDRNINQYKFGRAYIFNTDEELLVFIEQYVSKYRLEHMWRITKTMS